MASTEGAEAPVRVGARRTQEQRRRRARTALLDATAELVIESGVRSVTLTSVGERAGYSRGMVTHHFGSKRGLLDALVRDAQAALAPGLEAEPPGLGRLVRLVAAYVGAIEANSTRGRSFLVLWADAASGGELAEVMRERDSWFRDHLHADVVAGMADGTIRKDADPNMIAFRLVAELRGIGLQWALASSRPRIDDLAATEVAAWRDHLALRPTC